ncbi:MAG: HD domain-containing protein [Clostridia bacterium]|nr:HD domain-containing protein [Clostridia bacterium]
MNYLDILQDREVMAILTQIDIFNQNKPKHYGIIHTIGTITYAKQLAECFNLDDRERDLLLITCALHNLGHLNGGHLHAQTGAEMARTYLKKHNVPTKDINVICSAISSHTGRRSDNFYDSVSACMILADKMDFGADRIKDELAYMSPELEICNKITYVNVVRRGEVVELELDGDNVDWEAFIGSATYSKLYRCFETVCRKYSYKFIARVKSLA